MFYNGHILKLTYNCTPFITYTAFRIHDIGLGHTLLNHIPTYFYIYISNCQIYYHYYLETAKYIIIVIQKLPKIYKTNKTYKLINI